MQDTRNTPNEGITQAPTVYPYGDPPHQSYYGQARPQHPYYNTNSVGLSPQFSGYYNHHHWANAGHSDPWVTMHDSNKDSVAQQEHLQGAPQEGASAG
jgi:hypothetical protein